MSWCRRRVLHGLGASLSGLASCALPSGVKSTHRPENNVPDSGDTENNVSECFRTEYAVAEWVYLPFPEALREVGAAVPYAVPERFLYLLLIHHRPGCYAAIWQICSHGACTLSWAQTLGLAICPCHGSLFDLYGEVQRGPASRPIPAYILETTEEGLRLGLPAD